jgi:hypothetical protein
MMMTMMVDDDSCCVIGSKVARLVEGHRWRRQVWQDVVGGLQFVCAVFLWRGAWSLNERYLIADKLIGGWVNHVMGTVLLMALQLFSYVGACGCALDDPNPGL